MQSIELNLIKMISDHYFIKTDRIIQKIEFRGKNFFDKFERVNEPLTYQIQKEHFEHKKIIAHDLISKDNIVENIVFDYNGFMPERFWHRAQLMLREMGFVNFTAYHSKTSGHLHLYVHKGHTILSEAYQLANKLSASLAQKLPQEWRMFPNMDMPREFQILTLPYELYQKERGASWSKYM